MKIFVCRTPNIGVYHLTDKEILNIKPTISKDGDAILIVNYYDFEDCLHRTIYCDRIDTITEE
jgi:hypothetical protein